MKLDKELLAFVVILIVLVLTYFLINLKNINLTFDFLKKENKKSVITVYAYKNCRNTKYEEDVENISEVFSGIIYDKEIAVCLVDKNEAYCLGGIKKTFDKIPVVYFEVCYLQNSFNPENYDEIVLINYSFYKKYLKTIDNESSMINLLIQGEREGYIAGLTNELIKALKMENIKNGVT